MSMTLARSKQVQRGPILQDHHPLCPSIAARHSVLFSLPPAIPPSSNKAPTFLPSEEDPPTAKVILSDDDDPDAGSSQPRPREAASGGEVDKALDYMYRANRMASLAVKVKHIDVGVSVLSRFMEPKKEACADYAYISEEGFYLASD